MVELIPSFIVLGSLLAAFGALVKRAPNRKPATLINCLLIGALCFVGGLVLSAMYTRVVGNEAANPMIIAVLVAIGTVGALSIYIRIDNKEKMIRADRED